MPRAIPQQWQCDSVDIAHLVVDTDYAATDKVNSRKQPLSPKSSIAVRLLRYLKNGPELHCKLWQAEHSNGREAISEMPCHCLFKCQ